MKAFLKKNLRVIIGLSVFVLMLTLDILSKRLVHNSNRFDGAPVPIIPHLFNFIHVHNFGAAFGIGDDNPAWGIAFSVISLIAAVVLCFILIKFGKKSKVFSIGLGLVIAGALGNGIDRLSFGYVDDFIQFAFWEDFAVFNFADVGVICGLVMLLVFIIFLYKEPKKESAGNVLNENGIVVEGPVPKKNKKEKNKEEEI